MLSKMFRKLQKNSELLYLFRNNQQVLFLEGKIPQCERNYKLLLHSLKRTRVSLQIHIWR